MGDTAIIWTDKVWNVTRGCRRISSGCGGANGEGGCYAERMAYRFSGPGQAYEGLVKMTAHGPRWTGVGRFAADKLAEPLSWRKPMRIFVDSMSDLFFDEFTNEQIAAVFGVMAACPQHTFQVLTKRAKRMREWFAWLESTGDPIGTCLREAFCMLDAPDDRNLAALERAASYEMPTAWPLRNVHLGTSVENQEAHDDRSEDLLACPASVYFFSVEPMLGPVDASQSLRRMLQTQDGRLLSNDHPEAPVTAGTWRRHVDWVIAGCESGPGARPCDVAWLRSLRDQCATAGVPFFLKQATPTGHPFIENGGSRFRITDGAIRSGDGSKVKGRTPPVIEMPYLDGVQHKEFPK